jgi:hypothetical protein
MNDETAIRLLLNTVEGIIERDIRQLSEEDLEDYLKCAEHARRRWGRVPSEVKTVIDYLGIDL